MSEPIPSGRRWVATDVVNWLQKHPFLLRAKASIRPAYHAVQTAYLRNLLLPNAALRDVHHGKTCFLIGTGVSLCDIDLRALSRRYTFSCNEIFRHEHFSVLNLTYYTVVEPFYGRLLGRRYLEDVHGLYSDVDRAFKTTNTQFIFHATLKRYLDRYALLRGKKSYYVLPRRRVTGIDVWQNDLTQPITFSDGAIFTMIGAALYMGFKQLYILGCGYTFDPVQLFHFYDYPRLPQFSSDADREQFLAGFTAAHPNTKILGLQNRGNEIVLSVTRGDRNDAYIELHKGIDCFAKAQGARIINVTPEGFASPAYASMTLTGFKALMETPTGLRQ